MTRQSLILSLVALCLTILCYRPFFLQALEREAAAAPQIFSTSQPLSAYLSERLTYELWATAPKELRAGEATLSLSHYPLMGEETGEANLSVQIKTEAFSGDTRRQALFAWPSILPHQELFYEYGNHTPYVQGIFFSPEGVLFAKKKPCRLLELMGNCPIASHWAGETHEHNMDAMPQVWLGRSCSDYRQRIPTLPAEASEHYGLLGLLYKLRQFTWTPGTHQEFRVAEEERLFLMTVECMREEHLSLPGGEFDTVLLHLNGRIAYSPFEKDRAEKKTSGLFGLKGPISIWLEKERKFPVQIEGTLAIAMLEIGARIRLSHQEFRQP